MEHNGPNNLITTFGTYIHVHMYMSHSVQGLFDTVRPKAGLIQTYIFKQAQKRRKAAE